MLVGKHYYARLNVLLVFDSRDEALKNLERIVQVPDLSINSNVASSVALSTT